MTQMRLVLLSALCLTLFSPRGLGQATFTDVSSSAGTGLGDGSARGIAWGDFNNDSFQDLFVPTAGTTPNRLYMNNGNGTFAEIAATLGLDDMGNTLTCSWADFDNDGDLDLLTTALSLPTRLWQNNRETVVDTTFTSIENSAGISMTSGQMPAWADYNNDGYVDFYASVSNSSSSPDVLYKNNGNNTFTNVADSAGVNHQVSGVLEQAVHWGDYDKDGDPDLFIGNLQSAGPSFFHRNNGNGTFTEIAATLGFTGGGRGAQWVDYNNDGLWDFSWAGYAGATAPIPVKLFKNNGDGTFTNVSASAGITDAVISWGVAWADYDNNGYEDMFVSVSGQSTTCLLYRNNGDSTFTNVTVAVGLDSLVQLSGAWGDYDNDGDMDLYTSGSSTNGNHLFRNNGDTTKHWLEIVAAGTQSNAAGIGSRVTVHAGALRMMREINTGIGYRSQNMLPAHFGLDTNTVADSIIVRWPGGNVTAMANVNGDQILTITEPSLLVPNIVATPETLTLTYQNLFKDTLWISNTGSAPLVVDTILGTIDSLTTGMFRIIPASLSVSPGGSQPVRVFIDLPVGGLRYDFLDSLLVYSNDPEDSVLTVIIQGDYPEHVQQITGTPSAFSLEQNYPNPFNSSTEITFDVPATGLVMLKVYDVLGRPADTVLSTRLEPGRYRIPFDATGLSSGTYWYVLQANGRTTVKKMVLIR